MAKLSYQSPANSFHKENQNAFEASLFRFMPQEHAQQVAICAVQI